MGQSKKNEICVIENANSDRVAEYILSKRIPVIFRSMNIGPCTSKWNAEYLSSTLGTQDVKIHVCESTLMDFVNKNFIYRSLPFNELIRRASESEHKDFFISQTEYYYLRTIGENPRKDVADIRIQFPELAKDISWPEFIPSDKIFSSVFRIASANVCLWTHYDIMDNMLIQIKGKKRAVLFPPEDALKLYLNGDKSEVLDIDNPDFTKHPKFMDVDWHEAVLEEGDILFIPALWFHNMTALEFGVAVNVFWKNLSNELYDKKDPYGNKDLLPAQRASATLNKILSSLDDLPDTYHDFYCRRLIQQIQTKLKKDV